jgi:hypothetical protein
MKLQGYCNRHNAPLEGTLTIVRDDTQANLFLADTSEMSCPPDDTDCNQTWSVKCWGVGD